MAKRQLTLEQRKAASERQKAYYHANKEAYKIKNRSRKKYTHPGFVVCACGKKLIQGIDYKNPAIKACPGKKGKLSDCQKALQNSYKKKRYVRQYKLDNSLPQGLHEQETAKSTEALRNCLKCGHDFLSKSPYNRICDKCSAINKLVAHSGKPLNINKEENSVF